MTNATTEQRPPVTVIGLGAMGTALARALLDAGHPTTVWNRSTGKADALVAAGATRAHSIAEAVTSSSLLVMCVLDDPVVGELLGLSGRELSGRVLVNLTSGTPEQARARAAWAAERGVEYLDGKIMATPSMIGRPEAFLLYSGAEQAFTTHQPTLATLGTATYFGPDAGLAALYDLALLGLMYSTITGFLHAAAVMAADGIDVATFLPYATDFLANVSVFVADVARDVQRGDQSATEATLDMQVVTMEHIAATSRTRGVDPTIPDYVKELTERAIAAGHGGGGLERLLGLLATPAKVPA